jgi:hypothetical protein
MSWNNKYEGQTYNFSFKDLSIKNFTENLKDINFIEGVGLFTNPYTTVAALSSSGKQKENLGKLAKGVTIGKGIVAAAVAGGAGLGIFGGGAAGSSAASAATSAAIGGAQGGGAALAGLTGLTGIGGLAAGIDWKKIKFKADKATPGINPNAKAIPGADEQPPQTNKYLYIGAAVIVLILIIVLIATKSKK